MHGTGRAQSTTAFPGGFLEKTTSGEVRPRPSASQIAGFVPSRGAFTFPAPWLTEGARITNGSDCGGTDCVLPVGYSYWRNMNNHVGSDTLLMFLGLNAGRGGAGPTLFSYNKVTEEVRNLGALFNAGDPLRSATAEGWYFSATMPHALYLNSGARMLRYDVVTRQMQTVYDATSRFGSGYYIWQMHSSDDDRVHTATLRSSSSSAMVGCLAYREDLAQFSWYPARGRLDECHLDHSGRYMIMLDNVDYTYGEDNRIVDLTTGTERLLLDQEGAAGHADTGYGYLVNEDDWNALPGAVRVWDLAAMTSSVVYHVTDWSVDVGHISHTNSRPGMPTPQQYACASNATRGALPRANEIVCFRLDGSKDVLVVAPVMTDLNAAGGGDDYSKDPKGNLDVTGQYMMWTSNIGTGRLDAFIVKIPAHRLVAPADAVPPTVSLTAPAAGATVSGSVPISAIAGDNMGVAGVQFRVDGGPVGAEVTRSPWTTSWSTVGVAQGSHTLTATARDASGNTTTSAPISVQVSNPPPAISGVTVSWLGSTGATISWSTDRPSDTQVQYGPTTSYGSSSPVRPAPITAHSETLTGLNPSTLYHFRVLSRDPAGLATSPDGTFTTAAAGTVTPLQGLIGHWKFDETQGPIAVDSSGRAYHGTVHNGAARVPGRLGRAIALDGVNDYVEVHHRPALNAFPLTLMAWIRTTSPGLAGIVNKYFPSSFNGYQLFVNEGNLCGWYFRDASSNVWNGGGCTMPATGYADNAWHHVAMTLDTSGGRLYLDGVLKGTQPWTGGAASATSTVPFSIGRYPWVTRQYFAGSVDDVRLYGRALSAGEIATAMAEAGSGTGGEPDPGDPVPPPPASGLTDVQWTSLVNCTASGSGLQKTGGVDDMADSGAVSAQQLTSDGFVEFELTEAGTNRVFGLSSGSSGIQPSGIEFGIRVQSGVAEVRENGAYQADVSAAAGDVFRVSVSGGSVTYARNGVVFHTSARTASFPLAANVVFIDAGSEVGEARIQTN